MARIIPYGYNDLILESKVKNKNLKVKEIAKIANTIDYALVRVYNNIKVKESQKQIMGGFYGI